MKQTKEAIITAVSGLFRRGNNQVGNERKTDYQKTKNHPKKKVVGVTHKMYECEDSSNASQNQKEFWPKRSQNFSSKRRVKGLSNEGCDKGGLENDQTDTYTGE